MNKRIDYYTRVAIKKTIALHQSVLDKEHIDYFDAKYNSGEGGCPLCNLYSHEPERCDRCPWVTIQDAPQHEEDIPCLHIAGIDYNNDVQSIARLESWLKGEKYTGAV